MEKDSIVCSGSIPFADNTPPEEFLLLRYGKNVFTKSGEEGEFSFSEEDADQVITEFTAHARDLVIDYEHQSLGRGKAPAAGWIDQLKKTAQGLTAHVKCWTAEAARALTALEYRYFSPTLYFSKDGKHVVSLHSVALTNHPALHGVPALAADDLTDLCRLLDLNDAEDRPLAICQKVADLVRKEKELAGWLTRCGFADLDGAEQAIRHFKCACIVEKAYNDGKVTEAEKPWAEAFAASDPEAFRTWCIGAPRRIPDNQDVTERQCARPDKQSVSATESKILRLLGLNEKTKLEEQV
ncbi:MAG: hypothetical protein J6S98_07895 [Lentisphaeria bacterium]|nr:hypothetical protein [Lentisphaeria bacterium]MBO5802912.1 hypothetical protein [Lentisphaeria bacterium]